ncbi:MAG: redoxin domain-containing protein [Phycisphaerales bacterium]|nr:redoxin domain-containing protein [Phycisphaerales bacterium]
MTQIDAGLHPASMPVAVIDRRAAWYAGLGVALALAAVPLNVVAGEVDFLQRWSIVGGLLIVGSVALAITAWRRTRDLIPRGAAVFCWVWAAHFLFGLVVLSRLPAPRPEFLSLRCAEFTLPDSRGVSWSLDDLLALGSDDSARGGGPSTQGAALAPQAPRAAHVALVFYRSGRDPACAAYLRRLAAADQRLRAAGVQVAAVSMDPPALARVTAEFNHLPFPVLSDGAGKLVDALGLRHVGAGSSRGGSETGWLAGAKKGDLAIPAVLVVSADGRIVWREASTRVQARVTPEQILGAMGE